MAITASRRATAVQVRVVAGLDSASERQRSNVATPIPAHHQTGVQIQHYGQVEPPFVSSNVRDITHPLLIRGRCRKILLQQIGGHRQSMVGVGRGLVLARRLGAQAAGVHQTRNTVLPHALAFLVQMARDARCADTALVLLVYPPDIVRQTLIGLCTR